MFLYQIEKRQQDRINAQSRNEYTILFTGLTRSHKKAENMPENDKTKVVGIPVPTSVHERMERFIASHKDKEGMPKSKKALALACLHKFLDDYDQTHQADLPVNDTPGKTY